MRSQLSKQLRLPLVNAAPVLLLLEVENLVRLKVSPSFQAWLDGVLSSRGDVGQNLDS